MNQPNFTVSSPGGPCGGIQLIQVPLQIIGALLVWYKRQFLTPTQFAELLITKYYTCKTFVCQLYLSHSIPIWSKFPFLYRNIVWKDKYFYVFENKMTSLGENRKLVTNLEMIIYFFCEMRACGVIYNDLELSRICHINTKHCIV